MKLLFIGCVIILLVLSNLAKACESNVKYVKSGTVLNCDTWIVKDSQMKEFAKTDDKLIITEKLLEQHKTLIKLSNEEIEHYKVQSQSRGKELAKAETRRFWSNLGHFALGVIITGVAAKAAIEVTK